MKYKFSLLILLPLFLQAESLKVDALFTLYNINTIKEGSTQADKAALSFGGVVGLQTHKWHGTYSHITFMTTNALFLMPDTNRIDTSVLGRNNAVISANPDDGKKSFSVLGEAYVGYKKSYFDIKIGRQAIHSPLADTKVVRVLPTTFNASRILYKNKTFSIGYTLIDQIKQRTTDRFYNILSHALGSNTLNYTGQNNGLMQMAEFHINITQHMKLLNYYYMLPNFIQSDYMQFNLKHKNFTLKLQSLWQQSIGTFDQRLKEGSTNLGQLSDGVSVFTSGAKICYKMSRDAFSLASTYTAYNANAHSSVIAPFDGTPLFTDTITGNNLFQSNYGKALNADSGYSAGVLGLKLGYTHQFKVLKSSFAVARYDKQAVATQTDLNMVLAFKLKKWDVALKGIWVFDNNQVAGDRLYQYRVIANRAFATQ